MLAGAAADYDNGSGGHGDGVYVAFNDDDDDDDDGDNNDDNHVTINHEITVMMLVWRRML